MVPLKLVATLGVVLLFGMGLAAAALADAPPPTTTDSTTSTPTTAIATTTSTTSGTGTTTTSAETTTATMVPTTTTAAQPPLGVPAPSAVPHGASVSYPQLGNASREQPQRGKHPRRSKPLKVTPPLGHGSYVFPVVGPSGYIDTYGAFRADVSGKWHHGDDIFAPLGTPVVAVASGTIFGVGWDSVGGWRLWVQDAAGDEFYYAHLSGYARTDFHSNRVLAGEVIGFLGDTGDAFPRAPHLHFEVHPHQLLRLGYDGAVDPTTYLQSWLRLRSVPIPVPVHPPFPVQPLLRREARYVFGELLAARRVVDGPPTPSEQPEIDSPEGVRDALAAPLPSVREDRVSPAVVPQGSTISLPLLAGLLSVAVFVATMVLGTVTLGRLWR